LREGGKGVVRVVYETGGKERKGGRQRVGPREDLLRGHEREASKRKETSIAINGRGRKDESLKCLGARTAGGLELESGQERVD